jgi:hypothetical protein
VAVGRSMAVSFAVIGSRDEEGAYVLRRCPARACWWSSSAGGESLWPRKAYMPVAVVWYAVCMHVIDWGHACQVGSAAYRGGAGSSDGGPRSAGR